MRYSRIGYFSHPDFFNLRKLSILCVFMNHIREHTVSEDFQASPESSNLVRKGIVARTNSVSCRTVENWMKRGLIPFVRLSARCVRFHLPSVMAALRRREIKEVK